MDLHVQAADHDRNIAGIGIRQHPVNVARIWRRNPARPAGFQPSDQIWPESRIPAGWPNLYLKFWLYQPESGKNCQNLVSQ
jgi:hypothetical protein